MAVTTINTKQIRDATLLNEDVDPAAAIAGTKISANFGAQNLVVDTNVLFVNASTNKVGIGTVTPAHDVTILQASDSDASAGFAAYRASGASRSNFFQGGDDYAYIWNHATSGGLRVETGNGAGAFHFTETGRLGIGAAVPNEALHVVGNITVPGGSGSEKFGASAAAVGTSCVAVGNAATTGPSNSNTAIGNSATISGATTSGALAIGNSATVTLIGGCAVGSSASAVDNAVALGTQAVASGSTGLAIGRLCTASATRSMALGTSATSSHADTISIGAGALSTAANQLVIGGETQYMSDVYIGRGVVRSGPWPITYHMGSGGDGTNVAGGNGIIAAGQGTGTGAGGELRLQTAAPGSSGSSLNTLTTRMVITDDGRVGIGFASPAGDLDVQQTTTSPSTAGVSVYNPSGSRSTFFQGGDHYAYIWSHSASGGVRLLAASGVHVAHLDVGGNFGIGTSTPSDKLDVVGSIHASGLAGIGTAVSSASTIAVGSGGTVNSIELLNNRSTAGTARGIHFNNGFTATGNGVDFIDLSLATEHYTSTFTGCNSYKIRVFNDTGGTGTIDNNYGLYVNTLTRGTTNYGIYVAGNQSYLGGNVGVNRAPASDSRASGSVAAAGSIFLGVLAGDPTTPIEGQVWYNSTSQQFKGRNNTATILLG